MSQEIYHRHIHTPEEIAEDAARARAEVMKPGPKCPCRKIDNTTQPMNYLKTATGWNAQVNGGWTPVTAAPELAALTAAAAVYLISPCPTGAKLVGEILNGVFRGDVVLQLKITAPISAPATTAQPATP